MFPLQTRKFQNNIVNLDVLMLMNVENCQGGQPLCTWRRGVFNLFMPLKLRSAVQVDTGYVSRVIRATYCEIEGLDQSFGLFILKTQNTSLRLSKMVKDGQSCVSEKHSNLSG